MNRRPDITVVVPSYNEAESLPELAAWIDRVVTRENLSCELIFVDDGSSDDSWEVIERLKEKYPYIKASDHAQLRQVGGFVLRLCRGAR